MTEFGRRPAPALEEDPAPPLSYPARIVLPGRSPRAAEVTAIDPDRALFLGSRPPPPGTPVTAFIEEIGRVDGRSAEAEENGFWVDFQLTGQRRTRFIRHLRWLACRDRGETAAHRRHTRYEPRRRTARITLPGGREQPCEVIDMSLSGAALRAATRPSVGSPVALGTMKARVVRHFEDGFAIEFLALLERSDLDRALD